VDAATIRLLDAGGKKLVLHAASGLSDTYLQRRPGGYGKQCDEGA
jgi:hypothetical protein